MALDDILFNEGEGQDFILEVDGSSYTGRLTDITVEQLLDHDNYEVELKLRPFVNNVIKVR